MTDQIENAVPAGASSGGVGRQRPARRLRDPGADHPRPDEGADDAEDLGE